MQKFSNRVQPSEKAFDELVDHLDERYGSLDNIQRTFTNDPAGMAGDLVITPAVAAAQLTALGRVFGLGRKLWKLR